MENKSPSKVKSALNFGALLGLALMVLTLITYVFELYEHSWISFVSYAILVVGIYMGTKKYRDEALGGYISYGKALGYGVLITFFAAIILAFINYIYLGYIDDSLIQYSMEKAEADMYENGGMTDEQIEVALEWSAKFMQPGVMSFMTVLANTFFGFIASLIIAAFLKKENEEVLEEQ